jgi:uncharacterized protein YlxW (UPF0749 family)
MDKPPFEVDRKLSEYLFRNLNDLQQSINQLNIEIINLKARVKALEDAP